MPRLLLDTHILVWIVTNDPRLSPRFKAALGSSDTQLLVSPVTAYELTHLQSLGRLALAETVDRLGELIGFELVGLPAGIWRAVQDLPDVHRDPIDRMLIAHALMEGMTIVSADANIRRYPVAVI